MGSFAQLLPDYPKDSQYLIWAPFVKYCNGKSVQEIAAEKTELLKSMYEVTI